METGWTVSLGGDEEHEYQQAIFRAKRWWRFVLGTCCYFADPTMPGFWYFHVVGTRFSLTGKW